MWLKAFVALGTLPVALAGGCHHSNERHEEGNQHQQTASFSRARQLQEEGVTCRDVWASTTTPSTQCFRDIEHRCGPSLNDGISTRVQLRNFVDFPERTSFDMGPVTDPCPISDNTRGPEFVDGLIGQVRITVDKNTRKAQVAWGEALRNVRTVNDGSVFLKEVNWYVGRDPMYQIRPGEYTTDPTTFPYRQLNLGRTSNPATQTEMYPAELYPDPDCSSCDQLFFNIHAVVCFADAL